MFHNGMPYEELPGKDLDEFLVEFKSRQDIIKIEVWANDSQGKPILK
jgi:hypothetical protein